MPHRFSDYSDWERERRFDEERRTRGESYYYGAGPGQHEGRLSGRSGYERQRFDEGDTERSYWRSPYSYQQDPWGAERGMERSEVGRTRAYEENTPRYYGRDPYEYRERDQETWRGYDSSGYGRSGYGRQPYYPQETQRPFYDEGEEEYEEPTPWAYSNYWWRPGPYAGVGPRDYQRSDERILEEVCDRMCFHGGLDASDIEIEVENGEVRLEGTVMDRSDKRLAEELAESVPGVHDVHNRLRVQERERARGRFGYGFRETAGQTGTLLEGIIPGMQVLGSDGEYIGDVKEVRRRDFLVDRPMARDVFIPYEACQLRNSQVQVNVPAGEVDQQGWPQPELFGPGETQG